MIIVIAGYAFMAAGLEAMRAFSSPKPKASQVSGDMVLGLADPAAGMIALAGRPRWCWC